MSLDLIESVKVALKRGRTGGHQVMHACNHHPLAQQDQLSLPCQLICQCDILRNYHQEGFHNTLHIRCSGILVIHWVACLNLYRMLPPNRSWAFYIINTDQMVSQDHIPSNLRPCGAEEAGTFQWFVIHVEKHSLHQYSMPVFQCKNKYSCRTIKAIPNPSLWTQGRLFRGYCDA